MRTPPVPPEISPDDSSSDDLPLAAIDRCVAGTGSDADRARVDAWVGSAEDATALVHELRVARAGPDAPIRFDVAGLRQRIADDLARGRTPASASTVRGQAMRGQTIRGQTRHDWMRSRSSVFRWGIPAALGVIAVIALTRTTISTTGPGAASQRTYRTGIGQRAEVTLAGGTHVTLAPQTTLMVANGKGGTVATLQGEALFDVQSNAHASFSVVTGGVTTRVLGTTFDVRRYPNDASTRIAVLAGKITSGTRRASVVVGAGEIGSVSDSTATSSTAPDPDRYIAWSQGRIVFDETPVATMLQSLGRWYGYEFRVADTTLAQKRITTEFNADALPSVLNGLRDVLDVTVTVHGTTITLRRRAAEPATHGAPAMTTHTTGVGR